MWLVLSRETIITFQRRDITEIRCRFDVDVLFDLPFHNSRYFFLRDFHIDEQLKNLS